VIKVYIELLSIIEIEFMKESFHFLGTKEKQKIFLKDKRIKMTCKNIVMEENFFFFEI